MRWLLIILIGFCAPSYGVVAPRVNVEVSAIDETGEPLEGVHVTGTFYGITDFETDTALTDSRGLANVGGGSFFPVGILAEKAGYYWSGAKVSTRDVVEGREHYSDRQVTVVLKEKRNPIPLYAKRYSGEIPVAEKWVGFDLEKADWVAPHGRGMSSDFEFWFRGKIENMDSGEGELRLRLRERDGIVGVTEISGQSQLKVTHIAPSDGYVHEEKVWRAAIRKKVEGRPVKSRFHFLRLRTSVDSKNEIVTANYAKLYGDVFFSLVGRKGGFSRLQFTYYFNPMPNDRNLEFDPRRNLFMNLTHDEQVHEP